MTSRKLQARFQSGQLRPYVSATFLLSEVGAALRSVADRQALGKVIVDPSR